MRHCHRDGRLALKDLPSVFDDSLFEEVGPRVIRLGETLKAGGNLPESVVPHLLARRRAP